MDSQTGLLRPFLEHYFARPTRAFNDWLALGSQPNQSAESRRFAPQMRSGAIAAVAVVQLAIVIFAMALLCKLQLDNEMKLRLTTYDRALSLALDDVDQDLQSLTLRLASIDPKNAKPQSAEAFCDQKTRDGLVRSAFSSLLVKEFVVQLAESNEVCSAFGMVPIFWLPPGESSNRLSVLPLQRIQPGFVVLKDRDSADLQSLAYAAIVEPRQILDRLPSAALGQEILIKARSGQVIAGPTAFASESSFSTLTHPVNGWPIQLEARLQKDIFVKALIAQWPLILLLWLVATAVFVLGFNRHQRQLSSRALRLQHALKKRRFAPVVQPIVCAKTQACVGVEILMRWKHPLRGLIPPAEFIDYAERSGLIVPMSDLLMRQAHRQLAEIAIEHPHLYFSFNVTPTQLRVPGFAQTLLSIFDGQPIGPSRVLLELTERDLVDEQIRDEMTRLRSFGFKIAIDDFGTGHSSLAVLQDLVIDRLKIDRAFVNTISEKENDQPVLDAIITLAHRLNLSMVAEGIETSLQHQYLKAKGVQSLQGYLFSRPLTPLDFSMWLSGQKQIKMQTHLAAPTSLHSQTTAVSLRLNLTEVMQDLNSARIRLERNRWFRLRRYNSCLLGAELIDWLCVQYQCDRAQALVIGQRLVGRGLLVHVMEEHDFEDGPYFYRLVPAEAANEMIRPKSLSESGPKQWLGWLHGSHGVIAGDRYAGILKFRDVVTGAEMVAALGKAGGLSRVDAAAVGVHLMRSGMIRHVFDERGFEDSPAEHYHFSR